MASGEFRRVFVVLGLLGRSNRGRNLRGPLFRVDGSCLLMSMADCRLLRRAVDVDNVVGFNREGPGISATGHRAWVCPLKIPRDSVWRRLVGHLGTTTDPLAREQAACQAVLTRPRGARTPVKLNITFALLQPNSIHPTVFATPKSQPRCTMSVSATELLPAWAAQLKNPPAHKSKHAGFPDPPGYPSPHSSSNSKVACIDRGLAMAID